MQTAVVEAPAIQPLTEAIAPVLPETSDQDRYNPNPDGLLDDYTAHTAVNGLRNMLDHDLVTGRIIQETILTMAHRGLSRVTRSIGALAAQSSGRHAAPRGPRHAKRS
ncbi:MAG TPA: hypothetical protein VMY99_02220 [Nevskiaceae bacterium]|nr:hypothetical protein [Nevskiaceae bacterium]